MWKVHTWMRCLNVFGYSCIWTKMVKNVCIAACWLQNQKFICAQKDSNQGLKHCYYSPNIQTCLWWHKKDCIESLTVPTMARNIWMSRNVQIRCLDVATVAKNVWMHPCWPKMIKSDLYVLVLDKNDWIECWNVPMMHLWLPDLFKSDVQFDVQKWLNWTFNGQKHSTKSIEMNVWMYLQWPKMFSWGVLLCL